MRPPEDFELESLTHISSNDDPDAPLAMASPSSSTQPQPKWLSQRRTRHPWYTSISPFIAAASSSLARIFRPRLTVRYILLFLLSLFIFYRLITGQHILASPLPAYDGPHGVGAIDIEIALPDGPRRVHDGTLKSTGEPAFEVQSLLATVYYPTAKTYKSSRSHYYWFPKPISLTAHGYAKLAGVDNFIARPIFTFFLWAVGGSITIPAEVDAPLLVTGDDEEKGDKTLPVMVFSHGMASSRTDYTYFLGQLASRGHVIAAIEHRDGSCPGSTIKLPPPDDSTSKPKERQVLPLRSSELRDDLDTPSFKKAQLAFRDAEILAAIQLFETINSGTPITNTRDPSSAPYTTLPDWKDRLNLSLLTIAGHSYGATGALQALSTAEKSSPVGGIILDPGKSSGPLNPNTTQPLLVIHSHSWSKKHTIFHGRPHFSTVRDLVLQNPSPGWFFTSLGTSHPSVTDAPLLEPLLLSWTTGARLNVKEALEEYVHASKEFLDFINNGEKGELLKEKVTHEEYGKWVSDERKREFPKDLERLWEIHVSPGKE